ncbi:hypothetical protein KKA53_03960 [Candidatus Dependentiae bacterium]|nr:hypothetical protein [Candidatus Dependentiae bacterium]
MIVRRKAFTVLEIVVYLSLMLILSLVLGRIVLQLDRYILFSGDMLDVQLQKHLSSDCMRRDIMHATSNRKFWDFEKFIFRKKIITPDGMVVAKDISYCLRDKKLFRVEGVYDFVRRSWVKKVSNLVFRGLARMTCDVKRKGDNGDIVSGVWVVFDKERWFVRLRNGEQ